MYTENCFTVQIKTDDIHKDIVEDVETRFAATKHESNHKSPLPKGKNKKVIGLMKDEKDFLGEGQKRLGT